MIAWLTIIASLAFFLASLRMTALLVQDEKPVSGLQTLLLGWMGFPAGQFPWLANPAYCVALALTACHRPGGGQVGALLAIGFGLLSNFTHEWYPTESRAVPVLRLGPAFYGWMSGFFVLLAGATAAKMGA